MHKPKLSPQELSELEAIFYDQRSSFCREPKQTPTLLTRKTAVILEKAVSQRRKKSFFSTIQLAGTVAILTLFCAVWLSNIRSFAQHQSQAASASGLQLNAQIEAQKPVESIGLNEDENSAAVPIPEIEPLTIENGPNVLLENPFQQEITDTAVVSEPIEARDLMNISLEIQSFDTLEEVDGFYLLSGCSHEHLMQWSGSMDQFIASGSCDVYLTQQIKVESEQQFEGFLVYENQTGDAIEFQLFHAGEQPVDKAFQIADLEYACELDPESQTAPHHIYSVEPNDIWILPITLEAQDFDGQKQVEILLNISFH